MVTVWLKLNVSYRFYDQYNDVDDSSYKADNDDGDNLDEI